MWEKIVQCNICKKTRCTDCVCHSECAVKGCDKANCWECDKIEGNVVYCDCDGTVCLEHCTDIVLGEERSGRRKDDCLMCRGRAFSQIFKEHRELFTIDDPGEGQKKDIIEANDGVFEQPILPPDLLPDDYHCCFVCKRTVHKSKSKMVDCGNNGYNERYCNKRFCKICCPVPLCETCNGGVCSASCKEKLDRWDFKHCHDCGKTLCLECSDGGFDVCQICGDVSNCWKCAAGEECFDAIDSGPLKVRQCCNGTRSGNFCVVCLLNEAKKSELAGEKDYCLHCKGMVLTPLLQEYENKSGKPYTPAKATK